MALRLLGLSSSSASVLGGMLRSKSLGNSCSPPAAGVLFPTAPHRDLSTWGAVPPALPCASLIPALPLSCPPFLHTSQSLSFFKTHLLTHCYKMFSDRCYKHLCPASIGASPVPLSRLLVAYPGHFLFVRPLRAPGWLKCQTGRQWRPLSWVGSAIDFL